MKRFLSLLLVFSLDLLILVSSVSFIDQALLLIGFPVAGAFISAMICCLFVSFYLNQRQNLRRSK